VYLLIPSLKFTVSCRCADYIGTRHSRIEKIHVHLCGRFVELLAFVLIRIIFHDLFYKSYHYAILIF